jgi:hypothetical protein
VSGDIKQDEFEVQKKYFFCIKSRRGAVSKRCTDVFKHFTYERFFVAGCYTLFWPARLVRAEQEFRNNPIAMRKNAA